jgi:hypothetical protein
VVQVVQHLLPVDKRSTIAYSSSSMIAHSSSSALSYPSLPNFASLQVKERVQHPTLLIANCTPPKSLPQPRRHLPSPELLDLRLLYAWRPKREVPEAGDVCEEPTLAACPLLPHPTPLQQPQLVLESAHYHLVQQQA